MRSAKHQSAYYGRTTHYGRTTQGQRQLRVGAIIRNALADILMRGSSSQTDITPGMITIFGVDMSADLKIATIYIVPFNKKPNTLRGETSHEKEENNINHTILQALENDHKGIRKLLAKRVHLKFIPQLRFKIDPSPTQAQRIETLLKSPEVTRDLDKNI